ncbi:uncharacterized protein PRCAT00000155001 [Priceomyces carsonii]|uniref:uncharacterized protein n=1 Tax=Priceomyces carsonii TaxID=28549 RepID=UPI002ED95AD2|nr:unnamed protein product [Priceomyces carsonii]
MEVNRSRSISTASKSFKGRPHSSTTNSMDSAQSETLNNILGEDSLTQLPWGKIKLENEVDLEKQLIISAGGKREYVCGFILKLLLLGTMVLGCCFLIFKALQGV